MTVSVDQMQTELSHLMSRVQAGESIEIEQSGKLIGRLVPVQSGQRLLGALEGRGIIPDDIKTPFKEEIEAMFYGE